MRNYQLEFRDTFGGFKINRDSYIAWQLATKGKVYGLGFMKKECFCRCHYPNKTGCDLIDCPVRDGECGS